LKLTPNDRSSFRIDLCASPAVAPSFSNAVDSDVSASSKWRRRSAVLASSWICSCAFFFSSAATCCW
jgi:hypothetical protein